MPRKNYMTILAHETVQQMFDEFVARKEISKTVALNDMLEMYMLAKDEELYLTLKKKYLNVEGVIQMLSDRDSVVPLGSEDLFLFMKLNIVSSNLGKDMNGHDTMQAYITDEKLRGYTWFSTQSLYYGMAKEKVDEYNQAIKQGRNVTMLFCIGEKAGGENDIAYTAKVLEILSSKQPTPLNSLDYPSIWHGETARIWIKIKDIQPESTLTANLFNITSTGADLQQVIKNAQYHFGYVQLK